jgi:predicted transcriptional regulator
MVDVNNFRKKYFQKHCTSSRICFIFNYQIKTNMENHNLSLTELETKVLESLINNLYAEPGFSDVDAKDISKEIGISTKSIRGALGSLVKKEIVSLEETNTYGASEQYVLIHLNREYWYLHPEWKTEVS